MRYYWYISFYFVNRGWINSGAVSLGRCTRRIITVWGTTSQLINQGTVDVHPVLTLPVLSMAFHTLVFLHAHDVWYTYIYMNRYIPGIFISILWLFSHSQNPLKIVESYPTNNEKSENSHFFCILGVYDLLRHGDILVLDGERYLGAARAAMFHFDVDQRLW